MDAERGWGTRCRDDEPFEGREARKEGKEREREIARDGDLMIDKRGEGKQRAVHLLTLHAHVQVGERETAGAAAAVSETEEGRLEWTLALVNRFLPPSCLPPSLPLPLSSLAGSLAFLV